ncbi:MAG TPA: NAD(P)H-binding protein [Nonomuraea sp.]|nr:NAD(P)H-binding protein [Nonomuraea sp.]
MLHRTDRSPYAGDSRSPACGRSPGLSRISGGPSTGMDERGPPMIMVAGASGNIGSELVPLLLDRGRTVRAVVRNADRYQEPPGVEVIAADLHRPDSLAEAFRGVTAMFLLGGFADMPGLVARARDAGVEHLVLLSSRSVIGGKDDNAVVRMHRVSEAAVYESGITWTVLRPSGFMSNTLQWRDQLRSADLVRAPFADVPIAAIDPYDIAAVAATVLTTTGHAHRDYALSGPAALLPADQVAILAGVLDRPLRFAAQPDDEARAEMSRTVPADFVDAFFRFFADGEFDDSPVLSSVEDLTGSPARTYRDWALAHADAFGT